MATKLDIANKSSDAGLKLYRFSLYEASAGPITLYYAPGGWDEYTITNVRHDVYHSVLRKGSPVELVFYKDGKTYLQDIYELTGIDANVSITVEKLNLTTNVYESFPCPGKVSFAEYKSTEVGVHVKLVDTDFKEKVFNREDTEVDILSTSSIENIDVAPFDMQSIVMPDTSISLDDDVTVSGAIQTNPSPPAIWEFVVHISAVTNVDFPVEMQVPTGSTPDTKAASFYKESAVSRLIRLSGDIDFTIRDAVSVDFRIVRIGSSESIVAEYGLYAKPYPVVADYDESFSIDQHIPVDPGDSLIFQCIMEGTSVLSSGDIVVAEIYEGTPETDVQAFLDYEVFLRISQLISDSDNPFYSEFFGRTDTPFTTYLADGELGAATKGIYFRDDYSPARNIGISLKKYFETKSAQFRLGLGIENIGGEDKIRIEHMDYFYSATVGLDISSKLREQDIEKQVLPDKFYKSLVFGYKKYEYNNNAGLLEFNTQSTWSTYIKAVFNELAKVGQYRADGQGIMLLLGAPYKADYDATEDVKGDDDIFMVDLIRDGSDFLARTDEGFDFVGGAIYAYNSFNLRWSPSRNLRRWGSYIRACLHRSLVSILKWQTIGKNTTLETRLTTETINVAENADIPVVDIYSGPALVKKGLEENRFIPEQYIVKVPLTATELTTLDANLNNLVKLSDTKYGWILESQTSINTGMTEMKILRADLTYITPA